MRGIHRFSRGVSTRPIGSTMVKAFLVALLWGQVLGAVSAWAAQGGQGTRAAVPDAAPIETTQIAAFQGLLAGKSPSEASSWTGANLCGNTRGCYRELENVPHRILFRNLSADTKYTITALVDARDNAGHPGYDGINSVAGFANVSGAVAVVHNTDTSDGCGASTTCKSYTFTFRASVANAEIRFNARLALGSHLYGGSSLSARLLDVGARNVPIPVKEILFTSPIGIRIDKGGPARAHVGDTITYRLAVTLTTSQPLLDVTVSDPGCDRGPVLVSKLGGDQDGRLEPDETWHYRCSRTVTASDPDPLPNTATVTGTSSDGREASDRDSHVVDIIHPAIRIVKTADRKWVTPGQTISYTYVTTNTGDATLFGVDVTDDKLGHICAVPHPLGQGDSYTCTATFDVPLRTGPIDNVGTAVGHDVLGRTVRDRDKVSVAVILGTTVTPPPTMTPPAGLAFTGPSKLIPRVCLALVLILWGAGILFLTRRRADGSRA
jgi:hypothetical protein